MALARARTAAPDGKVTAGAASTVAAGGPQRADTAGARHCWVTGLPGAPSRCPGLLAEWSRPARAGQEGSAGGGWFGRVVYADDDDGGRVVLVEAWVPAEHLQPAGP